MIRLALISIIITSLIGCATHFKKEMSSEKVVRENIEMLYGKISKEQLYFDYPDWRIEEEKYIPYESSVSELKKIEENFKVDIFLGTWCSDSKREVPRFYKILKDANLQKHFDITLWAVDRKKHLDNGLAKKNNIELVPTFIFYKNGTEIGRIIEIPDELLEQDLLSILEKSSNAK